MNPVISSNEESIRIFQVIDKSSSLVEVSVLFAVGSRYDPQGRAGMAHLLEHMSFQGTIKRKDNKIITLEIENLGASIDAFTGYEYTGYSLRTPTNNIYKAVDVLTDVIINSTLNQSNLQKEKRVICEEISMYDDIPSEKAKDIFQNSLFEGNALGNNIAGTVSELDSITRGKILSFKKEAYTKENTLVSIAGNYKADLVNYILEKLKTLNKLSKLKYQKVKTVSTKGKCRLINFSKEAQQSNIIIGQTFNGGQINNKIDEYVLDLGNMILSGGMGSILYQKIREQLRLAYYVNSSTHLYDEVGCYCIELGVSNSNAQNALEEVIQIISEFIGEASKASNFERAKNYYIGHVITEIETAAELALWQSMKSLRNEKAPIYSKEEIINKINEISPENVTTLWSSMIRPDELIVVNVGSKDIRM